MEKDPQARIADKKNWGDYFLLSLVSSSIASHASPGQFLMVRVSSSAVPLLRRPFSIHAKKENSLDIFFQVSGLGTSLLSQKAVGDTLDILGPLGQPFSCDSDFDGKEVDLIGGGRGIAPLFFLAEELTRRGAILRLFYGGKSKDDLPLRQKFEKSGYSPFCSTDDGSFGFQGVVTDLYQAEIEKSFPHFLFACGPEAMLESLGQISQTRALAAEFSLESIMGCGFGACWGCVKKIKSEAGIAWEKICEKGPVFSAEEIVWADGDR
jgi:dihydroorotate dehydrogenase electron transfer subunit